MELTKKVGLDVARVREDFPILDQMVGKNPLVYLDNAASTQKPKLVIDAIERYYSTINSNIHRGVHHLSQLATDAYEESRAKIQRHINAEFTEEILFTKGATDGINTIAGALARGVIRPGDEILISALEHHSNIVPWQMLCEQSGASLAVIPMLEDGSLDQEAYDQLLSENTKMVAFNHISNALGTINPVKEMIAKAHSAGAWVLVDGAQSLPHMQVDVRDLDADFYVFSGHKMYGPTGIGVLYGKKSILENLPPYQGGGEMIATVTFEKTTYAGLPHKFEAGTPHIEGGIVLGTAVDYLQQLGLENIHAHEEALLQYATEAFGEIEGLKIYGTAAEKSGAISFNLDGIHPYDLGVLLDKQGYAVRTGHHCTQPIMDYFGIPGTVRASFGVYNSQEEVDGLVKAIRKAQSMLA